MILWRHECSRYASSSRIGYHPNHPSASHPSSRPSSAATILRPFSAGRVQQQSEQEQRRASSALPRRPRPLQGVEGESGALWHPHDADGDSGLPAAEVSEGRIRAGNRTRPRSAIPRLGVDTGVGADDADELLVAGARSERGFSASAARDEVGVDGGDPIMANGERRVRSRSMRSRSPMDRNTNLLYGGEGEEGEEGDEFLGEIYEDLDDEDDGELDNRISIMESRFSTVGRERPDSAIGGDVADKVRAPHRRQRRSGPQRATVSATPHSATSQRPPRAPLLQQRQMSAGSRTTRRQRVGSSARANGPAGMEAGNNVYDDTQHLHPACPSTAIHDNTRPPRVVRSRPTSAPADGRILDQGQRGGPGRDPMAPLHARWRRLQMSAGTRNEEESVAGVGNGQQQRPLPARDVSGRSEQKPWLVLPGVCVSPTRLYANLMCGFVIKCV